jgi:hypothetical protein
VEFWLLKQKTHKIIVAPIEPDGTCIFHGVLKVCPGAAGSPIQITTAAGGMRFSYCYHIPIPGRTDCKLEGRITDIQCIATTTFRVDDPM